jgi:hypothetical protein
MQPNKKQDKSFSFRIRESMRVRGIDGPSDFANRLSKRLGRTVNRQTGDKWMTGEVASIRADVMLAVAEEVNYSIVWLTTGEGDRERWRPVGAMDPARRELGNVYNELSPTARGELLSYAYRLLRVSGPLADLHDATPGLAKKDVKA